MLAGTWRFTELSTWGKGSNEMKTLEGSNKVLNMTATQDWGKSGRGRFHVRQAACIGIYS